MTEKEQLIDALNSVAIYLKNQYLSEVGRQVQGKVILALCRANKEPDKCMYKKHWGNFTACLHPNNDINSGVCGQVTHCPVIKNKGLV